MKNIFLLNTNGPSKLYHHSNGELQLRFNIFKSDEYSGSNQHMYIISDEQIKEGDWHINLSTGEIEKASRNLSINWENDCRGIRKQYQKIILTTDRGLILEDVQEISDEFLEWFIKNPNYKFVEVKSFEVEDYVGYVGHTSYPTFHNEYEIIIPKEETKQDTPGIGSESFKITLEKDWFPTKETLEEAAERIFNIPDDKKGDVYFCSDIAHLRKGFKHGVKYQSEKMYSEEEVNSLINFIKDCGESWDCDEDSHRYNTTCRSCEATKILEQFKNKH